MDVIRKENLLEYASISYEKNKAIMFLTVIITFMILDDDKKRNKLSKLMISQFIKLFVIAYILVYIFFKALAYQFPKEKANVNLQTVYNWMMKPIAKSFLDENNKFYIIPTTLFGEKFYFIEFTLRMYIAVFVIIKLLQVVREEFNITNPMIEFLLYTFVTLIAIALLLVSYKYILPLTFISLVPLLITLISMTIDRFIILVHTRTSINVNMKTHKNALKLFRDIFFNIKCRKKLYSIHINNNFVFIITSVIFLLNLCYQIYNIKA
uniref:Uncharacterized protein n=1 Tax=viral metagenome TaxID=1070528 RepID=A0A6C0CVF7_9ZZZZ